MPQRYHTVNGAWPATVPAITEAEARTAIKRLVRKWTRLPYRGKITFTTGNRHTHVWLNEAAINLAPHGDPSYGWRHLVHSVSHHVHRRLHPKADAHDDLGRHAFIERGMIDHVVRSGWLDGKLRRAAKPKPPVDVKRERLDRLRVRITAWERKLARAANALHKLRRQAAHAERTIALSAQSSGNSCSSIPS